MGAIIDVPATGARSDLLSEIEQFVYREARFQDEHDYEAWEALWTDDAIYWIPANGGDIDPETEMSIVYDNRSRISVRVRQLLSGKRYTQEPRSNLRHIISNVELMGEEDGDILVGANSLVFESSLRGDTLWAARNDYVLRRVEGALRMARKKVTLVNNDKPLYTLSFLI